MNSKRKLIISMLAIIFVLLAVVATIAIVFSLTQQTIKTTLNISYQASQVNAKVSASVIYADGTEESMITSNGKATSITFRADDVADPNGTSLVPASAINLTSSENYVVLKYVFENTGSNDFAANFNYQDTETEDVNMEITYSATGSTYKNTKNCVLVEGNQTQTYYVKLEIGNVARNAEFSGDISWELDSNIVVATPETAQEVLDEDINNKIVVFTENSEGFGEFGDLTFNPTRDNINEIFWEEGTEATGGSISTVISNLQPADIYCYNRLLSNVKFVATEGCVFKGKIYSDSSVKHTGYDPIKQIDSQYYFGVQAADIQFIGMDFESINGRITLRSKYSTFNGVTIDNCTFTNSDLENKGTDSIDSAIYIMSNEHVDSHNMDIRICNNIISGYYQGVFVSNVSFTWIENNKIMNTAHNAIAVQTPDSGTTGLYYNTDLIRICGNYIRNTGDRAIRFGFLDACSPFVIENNTFEYCLDGTSLIKSQPGRKNGNGNSFVVFTNNTYNGVKLEDERFAITQDAGWEYTVD